MMKHLSIIFLLVLFFSCEKKKEAPIPQNILSQEKMVTLLVDIHIVGASLNLNLVPSANIMKKDGTYDNILKRNHINKQQYDESMAFYMNNPELWNKVYEGVLSELSKKQAREINKK